MVLFAGETGEFLLTEHKWSFLWLKRIFGYAKTRYRGIAKNYKRCLTLYGLYNWIRLNSWREAQTA